MSLNIDGYKQVGNLWLPTFEERKPRETINFSENYRKEQMKARIKA